LQELYRLWEEWNHQFFAGRLATPHIIFDRSDVSRRYGSCGPASRPDARSRIRLRLSLLTGTHRNVRAGKKYAKSRFRLVAEVLMHEMVHQWFQEVVPERDSNVPCHGDDFCSKCNEIGALLRLLPVRSDAGPDELSELPSCAFWPHNARRRLSRRQA
jgi:hypothetical protein